MATSSKRKQESSTDEEVPSSPTSSPEEEQEQTETETKQPPAKRKKYETKFRNIRLSQGSKRGTRWCPFVPAASHKGKLLPLGCSVLTQEKAAQLSDRATIALLGRTAAAPLINFPIESYTLEENHRRYGLDLSRFLSALAQKELKSKPKKPLAVAEHPLQGSTWEKWRELSTRLGERIKDKKKSDPLLNRFKKACGSCPACLQPWMKQKCYRLVYIRDQKLRMEKLSHLQAMGPEYVAMSQALKALPKKYRFHPEKNDPEIERQRAFLVARMTVLLEQSIKKDEEERKKEGKREQLGVIHEEAGFDSETAESFLDDDDEEKEEGFGGFLSSDFEFNEEEDDDDDDDDDAPGPSTAPLKRKKKKQQQQQQELPQSEHKLQQQLQASKPQIDADVDKEEQQGLHKQQKKKGKGARDSQPPAPSAPEPELQWIVQPKSAMDLTSTAKSVYQSRRLQLDTQIRDMEQREQAAAATAETLPVHIHPMLEVSLAPEAAFVPQRLPHRAMMKQSLESLASGNNVVLWREDEPHILNPSRALCLQCNSVHGFGLNSKTCLMRQFAFTMPLAPSFSEQQQCRYCATAEAVGCSRCGKKPAIKGLACDLWIPSTVRTPWLDEVRPMTVELMAALQGVANAAVVDVDRPELGEKLSPKALLALGLLVEEGVGGQLKQVTKMM